MVLREEREVSGLAHIRKNIVEAYSAVTKVSSTRSTCVCVEEFLRLEEMWGHRLALGWGGRKPEEVRLQADLQIACVSWESVSINLFENLVVTLQ